MSLTKNSFLKSIGYKSVKLKLLKTNHYLLKACINGVEGKFILDSGASSSCICLSLENKFKIDSKENKIKASSATSNMEDTRLSKNNTIKIGKWLNKISLVSIDMTHINRVLSEKETESVDGIIGADVLKKSKAVIDYESNKLYLKIKI
ncbi:retroviral-like aspartic protease family protein [Flavobacteriaceae bacterium]|nr:retroviral-like aspartic protease family protein [Flavobacteriaceae bacterium]MDB4013473.1 retroviral-like aspartic protease family protein [Flavobacteriaceae bacterium]